jgi:hypothetical protein
VIDMKSFPIKDPDATLDYAWDWNNWLRFSNSIQAKETISNYTVTVPTGLTKVADSNLDGVITVWLSSGTAGNTYTVACRITTSLGRIDERSATIRCEQR